MTDSKPAAVDPSMELSKKNVAKAKADTSGRVYRVYCDGIFDMFHVGHMNMLKQAKHALGPPEKTYLLVGVCSDELTLKYKGKTVMDHKTRCESAAHTKWTDQVVPEAPWVLTPEFLDKYKIDFVAHDAIPYVAGGDLGVADVYADIKKKGMFLETQRTEGISTSDLIVQIVREYDAYVRRNLSRGYTKEQLNVGHTWELRAKMHDKQDHIKDGVKKTSDEFKELSTAAKEFLAAFKVKKDSIDSPKREPRWEMIKSYYEHTKTAARTPAQSLVHHSKGLFFAIWATFTYILSFVNPLSYMSRGGSAVFMVAVAVFVYFWRHTKVTYTP